MKPKGQTALVNRRKVPPPGLVTEYVLRGMIRALARKLANKSLTPKEALALLKEQRALAKQMRETAAARLEMDREAEMHRNIAMMEAVTAPQLRDETQNGA